jgi:hypothetical protein
VSLEEQNTKTYRRLGSAIPSDGVRKVIGDIEALLLEISVDASNFKSV